MGTINLGTDSEPISKREIWERKFQERRENIQHVNVKRDFNEKFAKYRNIKPYWIIKNFGAWSCFSCCFHVVGGFVNFGMIVFF